MKAIKMTTKFTTLLIISLLTFGWVTVFAQAPKKPVTTFKKPSTPSKPSAATLEQGKGLIAKSDCLTCHKTDAKLIGPAYKDVAGRYPVNAKNYDVLVAKIIKGGSGTWGQIPMAAHATLPAADVKKMVQYILSLK